MKHAERPLLETLHNTSAACRSHWCLFCLQVKRAEGHLLEALYGHISGLGKLESDSLLEEDPDTMQRRAATRKVPLHASTSHNPA